MYDTNTDQGDVFTTLGVTAIDSPLVQMLMAPDIVPGSAPSYELCKTIFSYHPLGAKLAEKPITLALSKPRVISVPVLGEKRIIEQFQKTWDELSGLKVGATEVIHNVMTQARIYGISSILVGERGKDPKEKLDINDVGAADLFFNVADPLNTSGSLVLNQDPNSPDFLKQNVIFVNGQEWHPSRTLAMMNEQPLYIDWTPSAFGFVGRSVYQRALFPLKSYLQTLVTNQMIVQKTGLLVAKMQTPGSFIDNVMQGMFGWKRQQIKSGVTGQVLQIGVEESVESLNLTNIEGPYRLARENILKDIAGAAGMPATMVLEETMTQGFAEGSEDFKKEVQYLTYVREQMAPLFDFFDAIVMRKAWSREFYETLLLDYPDLRPYETWLYECMRVFNAEWENLLIEPESERSKTADVQFKSVIALGEVLLPTLDPENKAKLISWIADNVNEREELFASKLIIDEIELAEHLETQEAQANAMAQMGMAEPEAHEPSEPRPFSSAS